MTIYSLDVHLSQSGTSLLFHVQLLTLARWQSRRMYTHLLLQELQNYNSLLNNHQRENVGSHQKKIPYIQGHRRSPSKMVGGARSQLQSNPIPARHAQTVQTKSVRTRTQRPCRDWASPVFESSAEVQVSSGLPQRQGSGCSYLVTQPVASALSFKLDPTVPSVDKLTSSVPWPPCGQLRRSPCFCLQLLSCLSASICPPLRGTGSSDPDSAALWGADCPLVPRGLHYNQLPAGNWLYLFPCRSIPDSPENSPGRGLPFPSLFRSLDAPKVVSYEDSEMTQYNLSLHLTHSYWGENTDTFEALLQVLT